MFASIGRWLRRRRYRPGRVLTRFLAPDVRRDVEVVDAAQLDAGRISARVRTWNVLYAAKGLVPEPPFSEVQTVEVRQLWAWSGARWGGPVPESHEAAAPGTSLRSDRPAE